MLVQLLLNWFSDLLVSLVGALPAMPSSTAAALAGMPADLQTLADTVSALSPVVPFTAITAGFITIGIAMTAAMGIHLVLKILSFATLGGGAT